MGQTGKSRNKTCFIKKFSITLRNNKKHRSIFYFHICVIIEKGYWTPCLWIAAPTKKSPIGKHTETGRNRQNIARIAKGCPSKI